MNRSKLRRGNRTAERHSSQKVAIRLHLVFVSTRGGDQGRRGMIHDDVSASHVGENSPGHKYMLQDIYLFNNGVEGSSSRARRVHITSHMILCTLYRIYYT